VRHFALSAIGRDRPGIVARVTGVLLEHRLNIEDSQMTILRGHFTMMLIVGAAAEVDRALLDKDLRTAAEELGLEAIALQDVGELEPHAPEPSHMVTLYGVDHPGIVHAATSVLAARGIDIVDLNTRLVPGEGGAPLYTLMMEVAVPAPEAATGLETALAAVGEREGLDVTVRELEQDVL
jgi:glycine cleavage system transcriptional repressor